MIDQLGKDLLPTDAEVTKAPLVSVVMNCRNGEKYLREAIESVFAQTYQNWEMVFWDNASTDRSAEIAQSFGDRVRYFLGSECLSLGAARNKALEQVRGDLIAFLDCDDLWKSEKLARQVPLFEDERVGLVYCDVISFNSAGESRRVSLRKTFPCGSCFEALLEDYCLYMSSVVLRKKALPIGVGAFHEQFNMVEELDLFTRIAYSWHLDYVPDVLASWRVHAGSGLWSRYDLIASESEEMLRLMAERIPDFDRRYERAVARRRTWIGRTRALAQWRRGNAREARETIRATPRKSPELIVFFLVTFFPARVLLPLLYRLRGSTVHPREERKDRRIPVESDPGT